MWPCFRDEECRQMYTHTDQDRRDDPHPRDLIARMSREELTSLRALARSAPTRGPERSANRSRGGRFDRRAKAKKRFNLEIIIRRPTDYTLPFVLAA